jgi:hypothetical protein
MGSFPSNKRQRLQRRGTRFLVPRSSGTGHGTAALVHRPPPHGFGHATINSSSCGGSAITRPISFATPFHGAGRRLGGGRLGNFAVRCSEDQSHAHRFPPCDRLTAEPWGAHTATPMAELTCRFIAGDPSQALRLGDAIYCGQPVARPGSSYCERHRKIVYANRRPGTPPAPQIAAEPKAEA